jgi:hypothetical protein
MECSAKSTPLPDGTYRQTMPCGRERVVATPRFVPSCQCRAPLLGSIMARCLLVIGITPERWTRWTGKPCMCSQRQATLNFWGVWVYFTPLRWIKKLQKQREPQPKWCPIHNPGKEATNVH